MCHRKTRKSFFALWCILISFCLGFSLSSLKGKFLKFINRKPISLISSQFLERSFWEWGMQQKGGMEVNSWRLKTRHLQRQVHQCMLTHFTFVAKESRQLHASDVSMMDFAPILNSCLSWIELESFAYKKCVNPKFKW